MADPQERSPVIPTSLETSYDGVKMYLKPASAASYYARQPALPNPNRRSMYEPSIRLPRSESFESLLELSVLASEMLEGGETDLEGDCECFFRELWSALSIDANAMIPVIATPTDKQQSVETSNGTYVSSRECLLQSILPEADLLLGLHSPAKSCKSGIPDKRI